jgi:hypothetical protein
MRWGWSRHCNLTVTIRLWWIIELCQRPYLLKDWPQRLVSSGGRRQSLFCPEAVFTYRAVQQCCCFGLLATPVCLAPSWPACFPSRIVKRPTPRWPTGACRNGPIHLPYPLHCFDFLLTRPPRLTSSTHASTDMGSCTWLTVSAEDWWLRECRHGDDIFRVSMLIQLYIRLPGTCIEHWSAEPFEAVL